jgi:hypothetical protein
MTINTHHRGPEQSQLDVGDIHQPGQFDPASNASAFYKSEGGADPSSLKPYDRQDRFAIYQHYNKDKARVDAGGAPSEELTSSYDSLRSAIPEQAARASKFVKATPDENYYSNSPYPDAQTMVKEMDTTGAFRTAPTTPEESTVAWDADTNDSFRALHDTLAHGGAGSTFSYDGESLGTEAHRSTLPKEAHRALTTEVLGQAAHHEFGGGFVDQKGLYDVPDWAAKGEPRPHTKLNKKQFGGEQLSLDV